MLLELKLAKINPNMEAATIERIYAAADAALKIGDKLFDISVDLSSGFSQYCPPISYFRIVGREKVYLRKLHVSPGDSCEVGTLLATLSTEADENYEASSSRALRTTTAGISFSAEMWSATQK